MFGVSQCQIQRNLRASPRGPKVGDKFFIIREGTFEVVLGGSFSKDGQLRDRHENRLRNLREG